MKFSGTFDETKSMPHCFQKFLSLFELCQFTKSKTEPIEITQAPSTAIPLDEKLFNDLINEKNSEQSYDSTSEWAKFHKYSNLLTFAIQFTAVTVTQGTKTALIPKNTKIAKTSLLRYLFILDKCSNSRKKLESPLQRILHG